MSEDTFDKAAGAQAPAPSGADIKTKAKLQEMQQARAKEHPAPPAPNPYGQQLAKLRAQASLERDQQIRSHTQALRHASNKLQADMKAARAQGQMRAAFAKEHDREGD